MSAHEYEGIYVRIVKLHPMRMARSGRSDLGAFNAWWSSVAAEDRYSLFPRDFMWYNPALEGLEWLYALPAGVEDSGGYEAFDFPGGLYAVAACKDVDAEAERIDHLLHAWIAQSEVFAEAPPEEGRCDMVHVITPHEAKETMGYHQMDVFVPIVYRTRAPA